MDGEGDCNKTISGNSKIRFKKNIPGAQDVMCLEPIECYGGGGG